jgi:uncharacterized protein YndB with AHSA1/START domain
MHTETLERCRKRGVLFDVDTPDSTVVEVTRRFATSPERLFDAWLDQSKARGFLFASEGGRIVDIKIDPRVGGTFQVTDRRADQDVNHIGVYHVLKRPRTLVFGLSVPRYSLRWSRVHIEILSVPGGSHLNLIHAQVSHADVESTRAEWSVVLERLAETLNV